MRGEKVATEDPESPEEYATRIRRAREEQEAAEERRKQEDAFRKAEQERQRGIGMSARTAIRVSAAELS